MAEVIDVRARFSASVDDAVKNMDRLGKSVSNFGGESQKASGSFLSNIGKITKFSVIGFTAVAGAVGGLAAGMYKLSQMSQSAESHQFRLAQLLRTTGGATEDQIKGLNAQAKALAKVGTATEENITQVQSQLATFDLTANTINRLTPAILDYVIAEKGAAATTDDFKGMTNGLAQALNGNFGSLTATGFVLDEATKKTVKYGTEQERSKALVEILGSTYLGFNEAVRQTPMGQIRAFKTELGDVAQEIGKNLQPVMGAAFGFLNTTALPLLKTLSSALGETFATGKLGPLFDWLKNAVGQTWDFIYAKIVGIGPKVLNGIIDMFAGGINWLSANGFALFQAGVTKLGEIMTNWVLPAIPKVLKSLSEFSMKLNNFIATVALPYFVDSFVKMGDAIVGWIMPRIPMLIERLKEFAKRMITFLTDVALPKLLEATQKLGDKLVEWIGLAARTLPAQLVTFLGEMTGWLLANAVPKLLAVGVKLLGSLIKWTASLGKNLIIGIGGAVVALVAALPDIFVGFLKGMVEIGKKAVSGFINMFKTLGIKIAEIAVGAVNFLIDKFNAIPIIPNIDKVTVDFDKLQGSMKLTGEELDTVKKTMGDTTKMDAYNKRLMALNTEAKKTKGAFDFGGLFGDTDETGGGAGGGKGKGKGADKAAKAIETAKKRLDQLKKSIDTVNESAKSFGETMTSSMNDALGITVPFSAEKSMGSLRELKNEIAGTKSITPEMTSQFKNLASTIEKNFVKALENAKKVLDAAKQKFEEFRKSVSDELVKGFGTLTQAYESQNKAAANLVDAQKEIVDAQTDSAKAVKTEAEARVQLAKIMKDPKSDPEQIAKAQDSLAEAISETAVATTALKEAKEKESKASKEAAKTFISRMKEQAEAGKTFTDKIKKLIDMGLSESALQQVLAAGAEAGTAIADELIVGGTERISETNELIASAQTAADEIGKMAATKWYQSGIDLATSQMAGIVEQINALTPFLEGVMDDLVEKIQREATVLIKVVGPDGGYDLGDFVKTATTIVASDVNGDSNGSVKDDGSVKDEGKTVADQIVKTIESVAQVIAPIATQFATSLSGSAMSNIAEQTAVSKGLITQDQANALFARRATPFAKGGVVTKPTMGLVGEAGAEAVIPLDRLGSMGSTYNISVNAGMGADGTDIGDEIVNALKRYERRNGALPLKVF